MLTLEEYKKLPVDETIRQGTSSNSMSGIYMTSSDPDKLLAWVARKRPDGWCIYTHWLENGFNFCRNNGDKVTSKENIQKLVPCDDEVFKLYVY